MGVLSAVIDGASHDPAPARVWSPFVKAILSMELLVPKRHVTSLYEEPLRTTWLATVTAGPHTAQGT